MTLLQERGINGGASLLAELDAQGVSEDAVLNTIKWWDDLPLDSKGTGLLVSQLKKGGVTGYRRAHERTGVDGEIVFGPKQASWLRRLALTPDGIDRETVAEMCEKLASKANTTPDALIDTAVDPNWQETPPHPVHLSVYGESAELRSVRYQAWVHQTLGPERPDPTVIREKDESDFDFSCRFWSWEDTPEMLERARKLKEAREQRAKEAAKMPGVPIEAAVAGSKPAPAPTSDPVPAPEEEPTEAPANPELDEKFGADDDVPWTDEDIEEEDPW